MTPSEQESKRKNWTDEQLKLAIYLYCQLPFGQLHSRNPKIIALANLIGRSHGSVAMKLVNLASLDPAIRNSGRTGLSNASALDRKIWDEFNADWDSYTLECEDVLRKLNNTPTLSEKDSQEEDYTGQTRNASVEVRVGQNFFRKTVLASFQYQTGTKKYQSYCCMSGVSHNRLLVASHIKPWSEEKKHRLNPRNGLCLSAIHDRAFDCGLITVQPDLTIIVSDELKSRTDEGEQTRHLIELEGQRIKLPYRFQPEEEFLSWHNHNIFRG